MRRVRIPSLSTALFAVLLLNGCGDKPEVLSTWAMGDKVEVGHIFYRAFETQWLPQIPLDPTPRVPQNRFFLVRISAVNSGNADLVVPNVTIQDDHGKIYEELSNGEGIPQWMGFLRQVHPADSLQGNVVFDAPPAHYKMRVTDETGEKAALIDIPLNFTSETPVIPLPSEKKE
jgi:hypothetical protein